MIYLVLRSVDVVHPGQFVSSDVGAALLEAEFAHRALQT